MLEEQFPTFQKLIMLWKFQNLFPRLQCHIREDLNLQILAGFDREGCNRCEEVERIQYFKCLASNDIRAVRATKDIVV